MTIIHPKSFMDSLPTDVAESIKITMHCRNRVDKMKRMMVKGRSWDCEWRKGTFFVDAQVTGGAYI